MKHVYANLIGEWVNLSEDENCVMGPNKTRPFIWWEENAEIWSPTKKKEEHTMYQLDYVWIHFKEKDYRINPIFIQIVEG
ncbi:hypothetical protein OCI51_26355 (plasmid) [Lysinibacillus capsici]|uniref:hypothetical protein n=1 Tax=Lysinibacillus capsici TaxID=2115968 RepID=UPI0021DB5FDF|nr:hypothetical protein [Lysinibacillus capsici]UYB50133.1 hypothetical protein OCI51_26745 [Lysinibacillus capsici]UYB50207.1 hypothetical protein OCI51_26355 [Lysinibacillus capsici]